MLTTLMKWIASAALLGILSLSIFLRLQPPEVFAVLRFVVAAGAAVVMFQAAAMSEYRWMFAFGAVACMFNPVVPIGFSAAPAMAVNMLTLLLFGLSLRLLKTPPRLTIASITDAAPGSESL
jgi:hypothetical protein